MAFQQPSGANKMVDSLNPLTPGGMNAKNVHLPTLGWVIVFGAVAFVAYHAFFRRRR